VGSDGGVDERRALADSEHVVITIGTPIDEYLSPRYQPLYDLATAIAPFLRPEHQVVLRSTVFPGTTRELGRHFASLDVRVHLSYCPERIAQGYAIFVRDLVARTTRNSPTPNQRTSW
jgi:UDP-N-acetyl-D-mannosaminuronic acid dehydrogenase